jgi:hypothetical protein
VPATNGLLYPYMIATDINDNISILNGDGSANVCMNLITIGFDGTPIAANQFDNTNQQLVWVANDSFGHTIVPVHLAATTGGAVRVYSTGTDTTINLVSTQTATNVSAANQPFYVAVDSSDTIWIDGQAALASDFGKLALSGANSHTSPAYVGTAITTTTSKGLQMSIDINNNAFTATSASTGAARPFFFPAGGTTAPEAPASDEGSPSTSTSNGFLIMPDSVGNVWMVGTPNSSAGGNGVFVADIAWKAPYTVASGTATWSPATSYTATTATNDNIKPGAMDGNNVMWWSDINGSSSAHAPAIDFSFLHGFDTTNSIYLPTYYGCEFATPASTLCGSQSTDVGFPSSSPYAFYGTRGVAVDSAGNLWTANGTQGHLTEVIGIAAPTWPMFIHNGVSNKP